MQYLVVYFSGTGNTKFISHELAKKLRQQGKRVEVQPVEKVDNLWLSQQSEPICLGIGYPVYDLKPPRPIVDFVKDLDRSLIDSCFVFSTYTSYHLDSNMHLLDILRDKTIDVICDDNFKAPGASVHLYMPKNNPFTKKLKAFSPDTHIKVEEFVGKIKKNQPQIIELKYNRFNKYHQWGSEKLFAALFYHGLSVDDKCNSCGLCVESCPSDNLIIKEDTLNIISENHCLKCLRCVVTCKQKAINFTARKRYGDYTKDHIKSLYRR